MISLGFLQTKREIILSLFYSTSWSFDRRDNLPYRNHLKWHILDRNFSRMILKVFLLILFHLNSVSSWLYPPRNLFFRIAHRSSLISFSNDVTSSKFIGDGAVVTISYSSGVGFTKLLKGSFVKISERFPGFTFDN